MDPASLIGLMAAVTQIVEHTAIAIKYLNDFKRAPKEQALLSLETASLLLLMTNLRSRLEDATDDSDAPEWKLWSQGIQMLSIKDGPLDQVGAAVQELATKLGRIANRPKFASALIWPLEREECMSILQRVERSKTVISLALQGDQLALLRTIKDDTMNMSEMAEAMGVSLKSLQQSHRDERNQAMIEWISPLEFATKQQTLLSKQESGSGKWLLESQEYLDWIDDTKSNVLWCRGIPGSGKTILASTIIDDIQKRFTGPSSAAISYVYCDYNDRDLQTLENIIGSLWKQMVNLDQHSISELQDLYSRRMIESRGARPTLQELKEIMRLDLVRHSRVFVVIDALDECSEGVRAGLIHELSQLPESVHLLITSRLPVSPEFRTKSALSLQIRAHDDDITKYVESRVQKAKRLAAWAENKVIAIKHIVSTVLKQAKEMFLLAKLYMDSLCSKLTPKAVLKALASTPKDLTGMYDEAMARISRQNEEERNLAYRVLYWVTLAYRPLTVDALCHALAAEPDEDDFDSTNLVDEEDLTSVCAELVVVEPQTKIIRMVHHTCQEYMDSILEARFPESYEDLARTCLTYLTYKSTRAAYHGHSFSISDQGVVEVDKVDPAGEDVPASIGTFADAFHWSVVRYGPDDDSMPLSFYQYAIQYWAWHMRECKEQEYITPLALKFFSEWKYWYPVLSTVRPKWVQWIRSALDVVAAYQLEHLCAEIVARPMLLANLSKPIQLRTDSANEAVPVPYPESGLLIASMLGRAKILSILIDQYKPKKAARKGISDELYTKMLEAAAWSGNPAAVTTLLEYSPKTIAETPIQASAIEPEYHNDTVISALSQHGFKVSIPLICSVGSPDSILPALQAGLPIDFIDPQFGRTGLMFAAERGRVPFAKALLSPPAPLPPAQVNLKSALGFTPLHFAVLSGQLDVAKLLVAAGADREAKDNLDRIPLMYAGNYGRRWPGKMPGDFPDIMPVQKRWTEVVELLGATWGNVVQFRGESKGG